MWISVIKTDRNNNDEQLFETFKSGSGNSNHCDALGEHLVRANPKEHHRNPAGGTYIGEGSSTETNICSAMVWYLF